MTYEEWIESLNLPAGVGVSTSEAFQAGRECYEAEIKQIWLKTTTIEDVASHIGEL